MMVENDTSSVEYQLSTSTGPFGIPFYFIENAHIVAELYTQNGDEFNKTTLTIDVDYYLNGAGDKDGGQLTLLAAHSGATLLIYRDPDATQLTSYLATGKFPATSHERALDKLTMLIQKFGWWWDSLALKKPNIFANYYDAMNNRIRNLRDPALAQDAATKSYVDSSDSDLQQQITSNFNRSLRVPDSYISQLPTADERAWKGLGFDGAGQPKLQDPAGTGLWGYVPAIGSFEKGSLLTQRFEVLLWESTDEYWRWDGAMPKIVLPGSTPDTAGGRGKGKWLDVTDATLRANLGSGEGTKLIVAPGNGNTLYDWINGQLRSLFYYLSPAKIASVIGGTATDITIELQAAMNDSIPVWIPAGKYYITNSITASANSSIVGPGPRLASIDNRGDSHTFIIGAGGYLRGWKHWKGFSITASGDNTADSYAFYYSDRQDENGAPVYTIGQIFSEIEINSYGKLGGGWYLQECFRVVIRDCGATGLSQPFRLVGSVVQTTIDNFVQNGDGASPMSGRTYTYGLTTELKTYGNGAVFTPEGLTVVNTRFVKQDIGVKVTGGLYLMFCNVEADYSKYVGFWYDGGSQVTFDNCYVGVTSNRDGNFVGFLVPATSATAEAVNIRGCTVNMSVNTNDNASSYTSYGVQVGNSTVGAKSTLVDGCTFRGTGYTAGIYVYKGICTNLTSNRFQFSGVNIIVDECASLTMLNNAGNGSGTYSLTTNNTNAKWIIFNNTETFSVLSHVNPQGLISMNLGNTSLNMRRKTRSSAAINATVPANGYTELSVVITLVDGCTLSVGATLGIIPAGCSLSVVPVSATIARVLIANRTATAVAVTGTIYVDAEFPPAI
ncbi:hypothetical protein [Raoultella ornithinolytica]|uniref:tail fiber/spike domain-containing protein n=1 Tax=Raoultella ornithinolytica TaxID=54291 RepID=UPI0023502202|nr:hypothetical protein [Raoultella ornithinolytica]MDC7940277.1 hypothetical protein [Raoultella ornithinolytica]